MTDNQLNIFKQNYFIEEITFETSRVYSKLDLDLVTAEDMECGDIFSDGLFHKNERCIDTTEYQYNLYRKGRENQHELIKEDMKIQELHEFIESINEEKMTKETEDTITFTQLMTIKKEERAKIYIKSQIISFFGDMIVKKMDGELKTYGTANVFIDIDNEKGITQALIREVASEYIDVPCEITRKKGEYGHKDYVVISFDMDELHYGDKKIF